MGKCDEAMRVLISYGIVCFKLYRVKSEWAAYVQQQVLTLMLIAIVIWISFNSQESKFTVSSINSILILSYLHANLTFAMIEGMRKAFTLCEAFTISNVLIFATAQGILSLTSDEQIISYLPVMALADFIFYNCYSDI